MNTRSRIALGIIAGVIGIPASMVAPWVIIAAGPIALVACTPFLAAAGLLGRVDEAVAATRILALKGFARHRELEAEYRAAIDGLLGMVPATASPAACSCIRRTANGYTGVLRVRSNSGAAYAQVDGPDIPTVARGCLSQVSELRGSFPIANNRGPTETSSCTRGGCHMGRSSIFYYGESNYLRPLA